MVEEAKERAERVRTDESLEDERRKTNVELAKRSAQVEETAAAVVNRAHERAEDLVERARTVADEHLQDAGASSHQLAVVEMERRHEDQARRMERSVAKEELESERAAHAEALSALLALEREQTDQDLTAERARADQAIRSRDEFLAMASHDMRNLLGGIALSAAALRDVPAGEAGKAATLRQSQRIQRFTARMSLLVDDLLDVVSIEAGRLAVVPRHQDATELVRETLETFRPAAASKNVSLHAEVKPGSLLARFDRERVLQVLSNIVGNAIKFSPEGARVEIVVETIDLEIRFAVADSGGGIAPEKLELIFERFWQSAQRDRGSLGLGLYIARCIVEAHGGRIWAESQPAQGSTFFFTLPAAAAH
jgi:signal transduction histidine kinase